MLLYPYFLNFQISLSSGFTWHSEKCLESCRQWPRCLWIEYTLLARWRLHWYVNEVNYASPLMTLVLNSTASCHDSYLSHSNCRRGQVRTQCVGRCVGVHPINISPTFYFLVPASHQSSLCPWCFLSLIGWNSLIINEQQWRLQSYVTHATNNKFCWSCCWCFFIHKIKINAGSGIQTWI